MMVEPLGLTAKPDPIENLKLVLENYDRIGIWLSGGADSALGLYLLQLFNVKTRILPIHGFDTRRMEEGQTFHSDMATENVIKKIKELLPNKSHLLYNVHSFEYFKKDGETKAKYHQPVEDALMEGGEIQVAINFVTKNPPRQLHPKQEPNRDNRVIKVNRPFATSDKRWVAGQYEKYGLLDSLFPLTVSCVGNRDTPCGSCFWCREKHWAFGAYDGGSPKLCEREVV